MSAAWPLLLASCLAAGAAFAASGPDPDAQRLGSELDRLDQDPGASDLARLERFRARQAIDDYLAGRSKDRPFLLTVAEVWVLTAKLAVQAQQLEQQSHALDQERDQIMLEASRRDAELARREAERLRLQTQAQQEEAERLAATAEADRRAGEQAAAEAQAATAQAEQARKLAEARAHEAQLAKEEARLAMQVASADSGAPPPPSRQVGGHTVYTLSGSAFASGSATLTPGAQASLRSLAAALPKGARIRIEGHTDSQGRADANLALSQRRADSVRQALVDAGIASSRLTAVGRGSASPVADNATAEGRARNRRVELVVQ